MIEEFFKWVLAAVTSIWGCVYVGSLVPKLWEQENYRGALGLGLLAGVILLFPFVYHVFR